MVIQISLQPASYSRRFDPAIDEVVLARLSRGSPALDMTRVPDHLLIANLEVRLPDILGWSVGPFIVTDYVRKALEALEPNTHKFKSIKVTVFDRPDAIVAAYHILAPPPIIDAIDIDHTMFENGYGRAGYDASGRVKGINWLDSDVRVGVLNNKIVNHHLWRLPEEYQFKYMCSENFWSMLQMKNVLGWEPSDAKIITV